jgi:prepilin-type N-terminal cleavage/methylation domain-containing protein
MTATSASSHPSRPAPRSLARAAGFTLIELLVVFVLIGLVTALVAPAGIRAIENAGRRGALADLNALLAALPLRAYRSGAPLTIDAAGLRAQLPDAPENFVIETNAPLTYAANGMAAGGEVRAGFPDGGWVGFTVAPVTGVVTRTDAQP